mgnify:CR=1 FL=1
MRSELLLLVFVEGVALGCRRRRPAQYNQPVAIAAASVVPRTDGAEPVAVDPDDLLPGRVDAYGLPLPIGATAQFDSTPTKMFRVDAQMPRVMRYLQQRLDFHDADIQPLGSMIRGARVRESAAGIVLDVGVRDEGDRTFLTIWNRTPPPLPPAPVSTADSLRAAGIDPATGQTLSQYNH